MTSSRRWKADSRLRGRPKERGSQRAEGAGAGVSCHVYADRREKGPGPPRARAPYGPRGRIGSYSQRAMVGPGRQERSWIRGAQAGSVSDLEALFREHWPRAHRAAFLVVQDGAAAEDIAQEAFLSALRNLDRFDRRRPFGPWLHRIVVNRAIDWARARALRREASAVEGTDEFDTGRSRHVLAGRRGRPRLAQRRSTAP